MLSAKSIIEKMQSLSPADEAMRDSFLGALEKNVENTIAAGGQITDDKGGVRFILSRKGMATEATNGGANGVLTGRAINAAVEKLAEGGIKVDISDSGENYILIVGGKKKGGRPKGVPNKKKAEAPADAPADAPVAPVADAPPVQGKKGKAA